MSEMDGKMYRLKEKIYGVVLEVIKDYYGEPDFTTDGMEYAEKILNIIKKSFPRIPAQVEWPEKIIMPTHMQSCSQCNHYYRAKDIGYNEAIDLCQAAVLKAGEKGQQ